MINSEDLGEEDLTGERSSSSSEPTVYSKSPDSNVLPVYFTILVVAFFLVIYTLTRLRCTEMMNGRSPMLTAQADAKQQLMLGQHGPGLLVPQVVTTITSPYYQGNTGAPMVAHPAFWTSPRNGGGGGGENYSTQPYNTVMHLYTSQRCKAPGRAEMEQGVSRNGSSGSAKLRPTFKAYYELLYAPGDAPALTEAGLQELPASVVSSLESKLASDSISWRMLARELGMLSLRQTALVHFD